MDSSNSKAGYKSTLKRTFFLPLFAVSSTRIQTIYHTYTLLIFISTLHSHSKRPAIDVTRKHRKKFNYICTGK